TESPEAPKEATAAPAERSVSNGVRNGSYSSSSTGRESDSSRTGTGGNRDYPQDSGSGADRKTNGSPRNGSPTNGTHTNGTDDGSHTNGSAGSGAAARPSEPRTRYDITTRNAPGRRNDTPDETPTPTGPERTDSAVGADTPSQGRRRINDPVNPDPTEADIDSGRHRGGQQALSVSELLARERRK
ncbi:MAG: hypothetical protein ABIY38_07625, partial [Rhodococcus sp. (in: high G+C Gram-positive bacteria)]